MRSMEENKELDRYEIVRKIVRTKLQETGDLDRLRCYVRRRLAAIGWKCDMMRELREIDERVTEEAIKKIKHCYKEALSEKTSLEVDRVSDVITNDSLGSIRYITEHRN